MSDKQTITKQITIASDHPSLAGHFPANPVVPGVVILDYVRQCIEEEKHISVEVSNLKAVKFLSPVLMSEVSSQSLNVVLDEKKISSQAAMTIEFRCMLDDDLIVQGQWILQAERSQ